MDYTVKNLPKSEVEITVTVPEEKMQQYYKKACTEISKDIDIKGFRKGHVPPHVLEMHMDKKYISAQAQEMAIKQTYFEIAVKDNLQVVSRPKVTVETEEPFKYVAVVAVMPEVTVKDYKTIKVPEEKVKVTEKDIKAVIDDLKKYGTSYKDVDRKAKKTDRAEIDFEGFDLKGKPVENTKSQNHPIIIGSGTMIPGFEDEIIGMKKGEKKEFEITFPKDYGKEDMQGKKLKFKIELKRLEEATEPELNPEFIEKMTGKKQTVDELKKEIEKNLTAKKKDEALQQRENKYVEELLKKIKVELPQALIDEEVDFMLQEVKNNIGAKGMEFESFLERAKTTEEDLRKKYTPEAEKRVKTRLALQFVIKEEGIKASDLELTQELEKIKAMYPPSEKEKIEKEYKVGGLKAQLTNKIALKKLFDKVLK